MIVLLIVAFSTASAAETTPLRSGTFRNNNENMAQGTLEMYQHELVVEQFRASTCEDLQLYLSSVANPTTVVRSLALLGITEEDAALGQFTKELPEAYNVETTQGFILFCISTATVLGNVSFRQW